MIFCNNIQKDWIDIFSALVPSISTFATTVLAGFATFYTYRQTDILKRKRKDNLYDKRIEVYNQFLLFCRIIAFEKGWHYKLDLTNIFYNKIKPNQFLFGSEIKFLITEIDKNYREIGKYKSDGITTEMNQGEKKDYNTLIKFFTNLPVRLEKEFEQYLRLDEV